MLLYNFRKAGDSVIRSMTGYGRSQKIINGRDITVEIRSVNHRYYEYSSRIPRVYNYIDEKLKALIKASISRGKVEVSVNINTIEGKDALIRINMGAAEGYIEALRSVSEQLGLADDLKLSNLVKLPDIFNVQKAPDDEQQIWDDVSSVAAEAIEKFVEMRTVEGAKLKSDVLAKAENIEKFVEKVEAISPETVENYRSRLYAKLSEILSSNDIDQQRIITEAALFADKIAVDEETVRLRSHIAQLRAMLEAEECVGRKLDFLVQEMNREVNTIGSKAQEIRISQIVVEMKSEIEKIREQIQNIE